ncbi:MAG: immunoglobulin domain-containing protein [Verrucomicrobia bacterium]|nr:immunoglobulin domain-containing protein [Verrucomicrobiota bacterium]
MKTTFSIAVLIHWILGTAAAASAASVSDWQLQLKVDVGAYNDHPNYFGVSPSSSDTYDPMDAAEPPAAPAPSVAMFIPHMDWAVYPDFYTRDIRAPLAPAGAATRAVWDIYVTTRGSALGQKTAVISWAQLEGVPPDYSIRFEDVTGGGSGIDLRAAASYEYNTGAPDFRGETTRQLRLTIERSASQPHSRMNTLPLFHNSSQVALSWAPDFPDPPIAAYTIQVYDEQAATRVWTDIPGLMDTTLTNGVFAGQDGHRYRFRSKGRTASGAWETDYADAGDTQTTIDLTRPVIAISHPEDLTVAAGVLSVQGEVRDSHLFNWTLDFAAAGSDWSPAGPFVPLQTGSNVVANTVLLSWDTGGRNGNHLLRLRAADLAGNTAETIVRLSLMNVPPIIDSCHSVNLVDPSDHDEAYRPGTQVRITIQDRNLATGLIGRITITRGSQTISPPIFDAPMSEDTTSPGAYFFLWDTAGQPDATNYFVETRLGDAGNHWDDNGANDFGPDLVIVLDSQGPVVQLTSANSQYPTDNDGVYSPGQTIRIRAVDANGEANLAAIVTITRTNGIPLLKPVNGQPMIPAGASGIFEFLWATTGEVATNDYRVNCAMRDRAGNSASSEIPIQLKANAPVAIISHPAPGSFQRGTLEVRGTASSSFRVFHAPGTPDGISDSAWKLDTYSPTAVTNGVLHPGLDISTWPDGIHTVRLVVSDTAARVTSLSYSSFQIDTTPPAAPAVQIAAPAGQDHFVRNGNTIAIAGQCESNAVVVSARLMSETGIVLTNAGLSVVISPEGAISGAVTNSQWADAASGRLEIVIADPAGNPSLAGVSNPLTVDNNPPWIGLEGLAENAYFASLPIVIQGQYFDAGSGVAHIELSTDGGWTFEPVAGWTNGNWTVSLNLDFEGLYEIIARATDRLGLTRTTAPVHVNYVLDWFTCNLALPPDGFDLAESKHLSVIGSAGDAGIQPGFGWRLEFSRDRTQWTPIAASRQSVANGLLADWNHNYEIPNGTVTLRLTCTNTIGSVFSERSLTNRLEAPSVFTALNPAPGAAGTPIELTLDWSESTHAGVYDVFLWPATGARPAAPAATISDSQFTVPSSLVVATEYDWQVIARNGMGANASPVWSFTTTGFPIAALDSPVDGPLGAYPMVAVRGTAYSSLTNQLRWYLQVAPGENPSGNWSEIASGSQPVLNGLFGEYQRPPAAGIYTYRLRVSMDTATAEARRVVTLADPRAVLVDPRNSSGTQDGLSWPTAFSTLEAGANAAGSFTGQVWLASGSYFNQNLTLVSGVQLLGSFAGTERTAADRNPEFPSSVLSGAFSNCAYADRIRFSNAALTGAAAYLPGHTYLGEFQNHSYFASTTKMSWFNGRDECFRLGGHMATITSDAENRFIGDRIWTLQQTVQPGYYVVGGVLRPTRSWVTGEPFTYEAPSHSYDNSGDCICINNGARYHWDDMNQGVLAFYVLEFEKPFSFVADRCVFLGSTCTNGALAAQNSWIFRGHVNLGDSLHTTIEQTTIGKVYGYLTNCLLRTTSAVPITNTWGCLFGWAPALNGGAFSDRFDRANGPVGNNWEAVNPASGTFTIQSNRLRLDDKDNALDPQLRHGLLPTNRLWSSMTVTLAPGDNHPEPWIRIEGGDRILAILRIENNRWIYGRSGGYVDSGIPVVSNQADPVFLDVDCQQGVYSVLVGPTMIASRVPFFEHHPVAERLVLGAAGFDRSGTVFWDDVLVDTPNPGNLVADPGWLDPANPDYRLASSSAAIDAGLWIPKAIDDLIGTPRPYGTGYDIGCFEHALPMAPAFRMPPVSQTIAVGSTAILTSEVYGNPRPALQWQFNGEAISGATDLTLVLTNAQPEQMGLYSLVASNAVGMTTSEPACLGMYRRMWTQTRVLAYGENSYQENKVPSGLTNAVAIAAGGRHNLALKSDGTVAGWTQSPYAPPPNGLSNIVAIAGGALHSLALRADGRVVGWGPSSYGETNAPPELSDVTAIDAHYCYNATLKSDGTVKAWGYNNKGQTNVPSGLRDIVEIAAGQHFVLARKRNGTLAAWGDNDYGQRDQIPANATNVVAIAAGAFHALALTAENRLVAWGRNDYQQCAPPSAATNVIAIAAGQASSYALRADGTVVSWGYFHYPTNLANVAAIDAKGNNCLALVADGPPDILASSSSQTIRAGDRLVLSVLAGNFRRPDYQWLCNGIEIPGATNSFLILANTSAAQAGAYQVRVSNGIGSALTPPATVAVAQPPAIAVDPQSAAANAGDTVRFSVSATGDPPLSYEWHHAGNIIAGASGPELVLTSVAPEQAGNYWVVVASLYGSATSAIAALEVHGVLPPLEPVLDLEIANGRPTLRIRGRIGRTYTIQYCRSLTDPAGWQDLRSVPLAENPQTVEDDGILAADRRFYRARLD